MKTTILRFALIGIILPLLASKQAYADDSASSEFVITGTAQPVCKISAPVSSTPNNALVNNQTITVSNLINQNDATVQPWSVTFTFEQVMCNYNAFVRISSDSGGMARVGGFDPAVAGSGEFLNHVNYTVAANWGAIVLPTLDTAGVETFVQHQIGGANQANLNLVISAQASTTPLMQGTFQDTIRINVGLAM